ncbi:unnamed protein product [Strongylus vulgaris]|uniref:Uncharacterized protein n=1 Tax=Strongylus vulgaris TaxID=40348 RepID=A0A3P7JAQ6_STRVU|nr:unnamed protein product [Strongylus vulgaris]
MEMKNCKDRPCSIKSLFIFVLVLVFLLISKLSAEWVKAGPDYVAGNRKRLMAVVRMECLLTLFSMFMYSQLMAYYDREENELPKYDRRVAAVSFEAKYKKDGGIQEGTRKGCEGLNNIYVPVSSYILSVFCPNYDSEGTRKGYEGLNNIYVPVSSYILSIFCPNYDSGVWTNLLGVVAGFFLINSALYLINKVPPAKPWLEKLCSIRFIGRILSDRKHQIKYVFEVEKQ